jgi:hypothetical protein
MVVSGGPRDALATVRAAVSPVTPGVALGLVAGKTVGVFTTRVVAVKLRVGRLPTGITRRQLFGVAVCAGIGFTVALFVTSLSFAVPALADSAKDGILGGSVIAGGLGCALLRTSAPADASAYTESAETPRMDAGTGSGPANPRRSISRTGIVDRPLGVGDGDRAPLDPQGIREFRPFSRATMSHDSPPRPT